MLEVRVNENQQQTVSARQLWEGLGINQRFTDWAKYQFGKLGLLLERDFITILGESTGGRPSTDYEIPIDIAKHITMMSGGERANELRNYFIEVEKAWNSPEKVMDRALHFSKMALAKAQLQIEEMKPKVEKYGILMDSKGNLTFAEFAKSANLKVGRNNLISILKGKNILQNNRMPYQRYMDAGCFIVKQVVVNGRNTPQTFLTKKGVGWLVKKCMDWELVKE